MSKQNYVIKGEFFFSEFEKKNVVCLIKLERKMSEVFPDGGYEIVTQSGRAEFSAWGSNPSASDAIIAKMSALRNKGFMDNPSATVYTPNGSYSWGGKPARLLTRDDMSELVGQMIDGVNDIICPEELLTGLQYNSLRKYFQETLVNWKLVEEA